MQMGKDRPKSTVSRTRQRRQYQPTLQGLERRELLAIDLVNVAGGRGSARGLTAYSKWASIRPAAWAGRPPQVGDVNGDGFQDFVVGAPTIDVNGPIPIVGHGLQRPRLPGLRLELGQRGQRRLADLGRQ